jgi:hypothetical protein
MRIPTTTGRFVASALLASLALAGLGVWTVVPPRITTGARFSASPLPMESYRLFDLGATDVDADGRLDLFTLNHSARQSLLLADGRGGFIESFTGRGLDQDPSVPGLEESNEAPRPDAPGLYVYRRRKRLVLRLHDPSERLALRGTVRAPVPLAIRRAQGLEASDDDEGRLVRFAGVGSGRLVLESFVASAPHTFEIDPSLPREAIHLGREARHPPDHRFVLQWQDRHGMAWADIDGDGRRDVFIARGGRSGTLAVDDSSVRDEFFRQEPGRFVDVTAAAGFVKAGCPGRRVAWLDADGDGALDLYQVCGNQQRAAFPNRLYRQDAPGRFAEVGAAMGLDLPGDAPFAWFDVDGNRRPELLGGVGEELSVLHRDATGRFRATAVAGAPPGRLRRLAVADVDRDGDLDAYVLTTRGASLLVNEAGRLRGVAPAERGLPTKGLTANWVDVDGDGRIDLHVVPGGLYRQRPDGTFAHERALRVRAFGIRVIDARAIWIDADEDGDRDLVLALRTAPARWWGALRRRLTGRTARHHHWTVRLVRNDGPPAHWLQVDLVGSAGNREAVGAQVEAVTPAGRQVAPVGAMDGTHYSQGDYRSYFGLGAHDRFERLTVFWPDGASETMGPGQADRRLVVRRVAP